MPIRATQPISSAFGTYMPGELITEEAAGPVFEAWLAAGIAEAVSEETPVTEEPKPAKPPKIEQATAAKPERAVSRRMQTEPTPQRRFQQDDGGKG